MARQRNTVPRDAAAGGSDAAGFHPGTGPLKRAKAAKKDSDKDGNFRLLKWTHLLVLGVVAAVAYLAYKGYLETRVTTPLNAIKAVNESGLEVPERFWGSYRPGLYFGMKTRSPTPDLLTGLMWMLPEYIDRNNIGLRHWCEQGDNLDKFGWIKHDGENFGVQEILDRGVNVTTSFVKVLSTKSRQKGGSWTARVKAQLVNSQKKKPEIVSFFWYVSLDEGSEGELTPVFGSAEDPRRMTGVTGRTHSLGRFEVNFVVDQMQPPSGPSPQFFFTGLNIPRPDQYTNAVMSKLRLYQDGSGAAGKGGASKKGRQIIGLESIVDTTDGQPNFLAIQVNAKIPFEFDVVFRSHLDSEEQMLTGDAYTKSLANHLSKFDERFEQVFHLRKKGFDEKSLGFAHAAMSNMVGGIGYFYGHSIVKSDMVKEPVPYWDAPLYTGVPSRSFFPRGFLWDEGFHNLLISKWNPRISADIIGHWLDLINSEGWIPREQILGSEARAKVPSEFVVQNNKNANPPTLLLTLHSMVRDLSVLDANGKAEVPDWFAKALSRMWPRLEAWYSWFDRTQSGSVPGTFRWRGRDPKAVRELNPKTLTSGLDDYPRASNPSEDERHVDLRSWMGLASALMADIANIVGKSDRATMYGETSEFLHDNVLLDEMHWSEVHRAYLDYGLHTDAVILAKPPINPDIPIEQQRNREKVRKFLDDPKLQYVNQVGYVSLFPLILEILDVKSPRIPSLLDALEDPAQLYTPYGLRSLSKKASVYNKYNTEHDAPYWRGPIWLNINYLTARALYRLSTSLEEVDESVRAQSKRIYDKLRNNLVNNIMKEYSRTGYVWEQYDDKTGKGKGCKPFTGWSALVVLLMSENY